jgi:hypothetical protein
MTALLYLDRPGQPRAYLRRIVADQRGQIEHLLDQPLLILDGSACVGIREAGPVYLN